MRRHRCGERFGARWRGTQPRHRDASGNRPRVTQARCLRGWTWCRLGRGKSPSACAGSCASLHGRESLAQPSRRRQAIRQVAGTRKYGPQAKSRRAGAPQGAPPVREANERPMRRAALRPPRTGFEGCDGNVPDAPERRGRGTLRHVRYLPIRAFWIKKSLNSGLKRFTLQTKILHSPLRAARDIR